MKDNELEIKLSANLNDVIFKMDKIIDLLNSGAKASDNLTTSVSKIGKALNITGIYAVMKKTFSLVRQGIDNMNSYSETLNMFHIIMGDLTDDAQAFQNVMAKAFGNNTQEQLYFQSMYQSLTESMGLQENYAQIISENMTKMAYDISSLFDKDQKTVAEALRAGLVGQTKPVRSFGMDITENSLQPILDNLGIDRTVRDLSQVEKEIVRYIAMLRQSAVAHGDMAKTIESPANQLRVFKNQLVEVSRWFGALFINLFGKAIVYINGFTMALKEILMFLASLMGFELSDYNNGLQTYENYLEDIGNTADDSAKKVNKLQTLGFDQINNINENKDSGKDDYGKLGGIDNRLLDAIKGYDNLMDKIRMKAIDIKNAILDWLGFLMDGDDIVGFSLPKGLRNLYNWWKKLNTAGKLLVGLGVAVAVGKLITKVKKLTSVLGASGLFKTVTTLLTPVKNLVEYFKIYTNLAGMNGLTGFGKIFAGLETGITRWQETLTTVGALKVALLGTGGLIAGFTLANNVAKEFNETGEFTAGMVAKLGGSLLTSATSGALLGASIGGVHGAIIGGILGSLATLIGYLNGVVIVSDKRISQLNDEAEAQLEVNRAIGKNRDELYKKATATVEEINADKNLVESLKNLTDENGKVKQGYETRVAYILNELNDAYGTEYKLIDGQITLNGKAVDSMKEVCDQIDKVIEKKKAEALLEALKGNYTKALKNEKTYYNEYTKAVEKNNKAVEKMQKLYNKYYYDYISKGYSADEARIWAAQEIQLKHSELSKTVQNTADNVLEAENKWQNALTDIANYENLLTATTENDSEKIQTAVNNATNNYQENGETVKMTLADQLSYAIDYNNKMKEKFDKTGDEISRKQYEQSQESLKILLNNLVEQSKTVNNLTPEIVDEWGKLAETSEEEFMRRLSQLPADIQTEIIDRMEEKGYKIPEKLQTGIDRKKPKVKVDVDTTDAETKLGNWLTKIKNLLGKGLTIGVQGILENSVGRARLNANGGVFSQGSWKPITQYANGGLPSTGELFVAREAGAELVGKIGNSTAVMNNMQIVDSVKAGVYEAVRDAMNTNGGKSQAIKVYASKDVIVETAINGINSITRQTGESPIDVW